MQYSALDIHWKPPLFVGILAAMWHHAESKGQVYGHLHAYLFDNESSLSTLSEFIVYALPYHEPLTS